MFVTTNAAYANFYTCFGGTRFSKQMLAPLGPLVDETNTGKLWKKKKHSCQSGTDWYWYKVLVLVHGKISGSWRMSHHMKVVSIISVPRDVI